MRNIGHEKKMTTHLKTITFFTTYSVVNMVLGNSWL